MFTKNSSGGSTTLNPIACFYLCLLCAVKNSQVMVRPEFYRVILSLHNKLVSESNCLFVNSRLVGNMFAAIISFLSGLPPGWRLRVKLKVWTLRWSYTLIMQSVWWQHFSIWCSPDSSKCKPGVLVGAFHIHWIDCRRLEQRLIPLWTRRYAEVLLYVVGLGLNKWDPF